MAEGLRLNSLKPAPGRIVQAKRPGRGIGSGIGKTGGRGHKGQKSRSGGTIRPGFEGGQMPLQKRLPKYGFKSRIGQKTAEIRLAELNKVEGDRVDLDGLRAAGLIGQGITRARIFLSGDLQKSVSVVGIPVSKGALAAIEAAGGSVEA